MSKLSWVLIIIVSIIIFIFLWIFFPLLFMWWNGILDIMPLMLVFTILLSINLFFLTFWWSKVRDSVIDKNLVFYRLWRYFLILNTWMMIDIMIFDEPWHFFIPVIICTILTDYWIKIFQSNPREVSLRKIELLIRKIVKWKYIVVITITSFILAALDNWWEETWLLIWLAINGILIFKIKYGK